MKKIALIALALLALPVAAVAQTLVDGRRVGASNPLPTFTAATRLAAVTPSDSTDLPEVTRGLWIGVSGDVAVIAEGDTAPVVLKGVPVGRLDIRAKRVRSTGTTATDIVAMY